MPKKTLLQKTVLVASVLALATVSWGQALPDPPQKELKALDWLVGEWASEPSVWDFDNIRMDIDFTLKVEWDGQYLRESKVSDFDGAMTVTETRMIGYHPDSHRFFSFTFSSFGEVPGVEWGNLDGSKLEMRGHQWGDSDKEVYGRTTMKKVNKNTFTLVIEFKDGNDWQVINEATFTRKKNGSSKEAEAPKSSVEKK